MHTSPRLPVLIASLVLAAGAVVGASGTAAVGATTPGTPTPTTTAPAATTWSTQSPPLPAVPNGTLDKISCPVGSTCHAVGSRTDNHGVSQPFAANLAVGTSTWTVHSPTAPAGAVGTELSDVSCTGTTCVAVGSAATEASDSHAFVATLNGSVWSSQDLTGAADVVELSSVSCSSATSCVAVSTFDSDILTGTTWTESAFAFPVENGSPVSTYAIGDVSCSGGLCVAVGYSSNGPGTSFPLIETLSGTTWTQQTPAVDAGELSAVSCASTTFCMAVGPRQSELWNGSTWSVIAADSNLPYTDVSCASRSSCLATGETYQGQAVPAAESWTGDTGWVLDSPVAPPATGQALLTGVSCRPGSACQSVGFYTGAYAAELPLSEVSSGTGFDTIAVPAPAGAPDAPSLAGVSCTTAATCTAVGNFGPNTYRPGAFVSRWNGTSWSTTTLPTPAGFSGGALTSVSCPTSTSCTAAGYDTDDQTGADGLLVETWNGTTWAVAGTPVPPGSSSAQLTSVSCPAVTACTAVGWSSDSGGVQSVLALRWNGSSWALQHIPHLGNTNSSSFASVSCVTATLCTAVGTAQSSTSFRQVTLAEQWDGTSWARQTSYGVPSTQNQLYSVSCPTTTQCTAVGSSGSHLLAEVWTSGSSWARQPVPGGPAGAQSTLPAVSCAAATSCTAVGTYVDSSDRNAPFTDVWDGTVWTRQLMGGPAGSSTTMTAVSCVSAIACAAVGAQPGTATGTATVPLAKGEGGA